MVEVDGVGWPSRSRCQAMVAGPASRPRAVSSVRRATIRAWTSSGVRLRAGQRPARARLEGVKPALPVPAEEAVQMPAAHPVLGRGGGDGQLR